MKKDWCDRFLDEARILSQLNHPNIVKFVNIVETDTRIFMVMELIQGGTLMQLLDDREKQDKALTDEECATIMRSIFSALKYIHSEGIVHRDLKPGKKSNLASLIYIENILLKDKNDLSSIKICDFGLSA